MPPRPPKPPKPPRPPRGCCGCICLPAFAVTIAGIIIALVAIF